MRLLTERRHILRRDICTSGMVHLHYLHTYKYEKGDTSNDINITLLNDVVKEEVYVEKPLGVKTHDRKNHVCKLKKALYKLTDGCKKKFSTKFNIEDLGIQ